MNQFKWCLGLGIVGIAASGLFIYSGLYNIGADAPHYRPTALLIEALRERSIAVRAARVRQPDDLGSPERIRRGAGNYDAMCTGCHLRPGLANTEIRKGLYPVPPDLVDHPAEDPAEQFWVIKHGVKLTAMPAWVLAGVDDETIWDMVALLQVLPQLTPDEYRELVASSDGHSHTGADTHSAHDHMSEHDQGNHHHDHEGSNPHAH